MENENKNQGKKWNPKWIIEPLEESEITLLEERAVGAILEAVLDRINKHGFRVRFYHEQRAKAPSTEAE